MQEKIVANYSHCNKKAACFELPLSKISVVTRIVYIYLRGSILQYIYLLYPYKFLSI